MTNKAASHHGQGGTNQAPPKATPEQAAAATAAAPHLGKALLVTRDIINALQEAGILTDTGDFDVSVVAEDAKAIALVEGILVANGVPVPERVDQIIRALPSILAILDATGGILSRAPQPTGPAPKS